MIDAHALRLFLEDLEHDLRFAEDPSLGEILVRSDLGSFHTRFTGPVRTRTGWRHRRLWIWRINGEKFGCWSWQPGFPPVVAP